VEAKELTCPKSTAPKKEIYHTNQEQKMSTDQKGEGKRPF
jgi:hypothetical protein